MRRMRSVLVQVRKQHNLSVHDGVACIHIRICQALNSDLGPSVCLPQNVMKRRLSKADESGLFLACWTHGAIEDCRSRPRTPFKELDELQWYDHISREDTERYGENIQIW